MPPCTVREESTCVPFRHPALDILYPGVRIEAANQSRSKAARGRAPAPLPRTAIRRRVAPAAEGTWPACAAHGELRAAPEAVFRAAAAATAAAGHAGHRAAVWPHHAAEDGGTAAAGSATPAGRIVRRVPRRLHREVRRVHHGRCGQVSEQPALRPACQRAAHRRHHHAELYDVPSWEACFCCCVGEGGQRRSAMGPHPGTSSAERAGAPQYTWVPNVLGAGWGA